MDFQFDVSEKIDFSALKETNLKKKVFEKH